MTDNWAVIPVKGLTESKTRLSTSLQGEKRRILVEALLEDVLSSIFRSRVYETVMLISPDENVGNRFRSQEVSFLKQIGLGLNRAIEQANRLATQKHARSLTTVLADIPLVDPGDFKELLSIGPSVRKVVMAPSFKGGTNVMLTSPPGDRKSTRLNSSHLVISYAVFCLKKKKKKHKSIYNYSICSINNNVLTD